MRAKREEEPLAGPNNKALVLVKFRKLDSGVVRL
jgi:hypothetical protein